MKLLSKLALALIVTMATAWAGSEEAKSDKPHMMASRTMTMNATVDAVNYETREVTLTGEGGTMTFIAGDDVRNLAQVEAGDLVMAEFHEQIEIQVFANPEGLEPAAGEFTAEKAAELGDMPGAAAMDTVVITAVVEDINIEANTFKLRGPEGNVKEFVAMNPENLKKSEVGDLVVISKTQAMGILVEHPPAAE